MNTSAPTNDPVVLGFIEVAALTFRAEGLLLPPVPRELASALLQFGPTVFGTKNRDPNNRATWLAMAQDTKAPAQVLFGHVGHGVNSYQLCYQLIRGPLAVFVRQSFGGAYGDRNAEAAKFNDVVERLEELFVYADAALAAGRMKAGQRLIIAIDEQDPSGWTMNPGGAWHDNDHPIDLVVKAIGPK